MKINPYIKRNFVKLILAVIIVFCVGYTVGCIFPIRLFVFTLKPTQLTTYEFYRLIITTIAAFITLGAVFVALFKESLLEIKNYVQLTITPKEKDYWKERKVETGEGDDLAIKALFYYIPLTVTNKGTIQATGCNIKLKSLIFKEREDSKEKQIDVSSAKPIIWKLSENYQTSIPSEDHDEVVVIKLFRETASRPGEDERKLPQLTIGGIDANNNFNSGIWTMIFFIFYDNCRKPVKYKLEMTWDGNWKTRLHDMEDFTIKELQP